MVLLLILGADVTEALDGMLEVRLRCEHAEDYKNTQVSSVVKGGEDGGSYGTIDREGEGWTRMKVHPSALENSCRFV